MRIPKASPDIDPIRVLFADEDLVERVFSSGVYRPTIGERYIHWDNLRFRPVPSGLRLGMSAS